MGANRRRLRGFAAESKANPFEQKWARRAANVTKRAEVKAALVAQIRSKGKANAFVDRRIAEDDPLMSLEDRYLARFQRERSKRSAKRAKYNLSEEEDKDNALSFSATQNNSTFSSLNGFSQEDILAESAAGGHDATPPDHRPQGRAASASILRDDYVDQGLDSDEDENDAARNIGHHPVQAKDHDDSDLESGGFRRVQKVNDDPDRTRTHKEIMEEVIARSKTHKAERQREKAVVDEQTAILDSQLPEILRMLNSAQRTDVSALSGHTQQVLESTHNIQVTLSTKPSQSSDISQTDPPQSTFDYERVFSELAHEKRAYATDRTKTAEEIDAEERDRLEALERLRRKRMQSMEDETIEDTGDESKFKFTKSNRNFRPGADDLEDDFTEEKEVKEDDEDEYEESSDSDSDNEDGTESQSLNDSEQLSSEAEPSEMKTKQTEGHDNSILTCPILSRSAEFPRSDPITVVDRPVFPPPLHSRKSDDTIPFVFKACPGSLEDLHSLFDGLSCAHRDIVLTRLQKWAVHSNKTQLAGLLHCILSYIDNSTVLDMRCGLPLEDFASIGEEIEILMPHLYQLAGMHPDVVTSWARNHIGNAYAALVEMTDTSDINSNRGLAWYWPPGQLLILRAISQLFPGSDLRHVITTPLCMLLAHCLSSAPILNLNDISVATFVGSMLFELLVPAKRYSGELVGFIGEALISQSVEKISGWRKQRIPAGLLAGASGKDAGPLKMSDCLLASDVLSASAISGWKSRVVNALVTLSHQILLGGKLKNIRAAVEPIIFSLDILLLKTEDQRAQSLLKEILEMCAVEEKERWPLQLYTRSKSASMPRLLNPKLRSDPILSEGRNRRTGAQSDMEVQRRLRRSVNKEARSAARELRRDGEVIAAERLRTKEEEDLRRTVKSGQIRMFMEQQRHDSKRQTKAVPLGTEGIAASARKRKKW